MLIYHRNVSVSIVALIRKRNNDELSNCYATGQQYIYIVFS
jgi:hypothetical protein